jgi:hypothetical protein
MDRATFEKLQHIASIFEQSYEHNQRSLNDRWDNGDKAHFQSVAKDPVALSLLNDILDSSPALDAFFAACI